MEPDLTKSALIGAAGAMRRLEWGDLQELVLQIHELEDGVVVDLPASRYEGVIDLVERELEHCGSWLTIDLTRQTNVLLLTAKSSKPEGQAQIRSIMGIDSWD